MNSKIILKNPAIVQAITFFKKNSFDENVLIKYLETLFDKSFYNRELVIDKDFKLKYNLISEIDYITIELWFVSIHINYEIINIDLLEKYILLNINFTQLELDIFNEKVYIICDNNLELNFSDELLYDIFYKKIDSVRYIYSSIENNEFIVNFLKHIIKFDIYYSKILNFYKKFSITYPDLQKSNFTLIQDYSKIIEWDTKNLNQDSLVALNKKINNLQAVNFWLMYDIESLQSNLENLESRLKTIGGEKSRYFLNHIEKVKFIIDAFDSVLKKNNLIKENVLDNYINFTKNNIEQQKLENEGKKINHIKNIKEILSGLAFIEIFINWFAESSKIFAFSEWISKILQNTAFMRMVLILIFVILYFCFYLFKKYYFLVWKK